MSNINSGKFEIVYIILENKYKLYAGRYLLNIIIVIICNV